MTAWFDHPAVQAAVLPFAVALVLGLLLARTRYLAVVAVCGMLVLLYLTIGFALEPMTSVRKLVVVTLAAGVLASVVEVAAFRGRKSLITSLAVAAGLAAVWVAWRLLGQMEAGPAVLAGLAIFTFVLSLVGGTLASGDPLRASVLGTALGWGNGALAVLGASALLGQIGIALGTACAGAALAQMLFGRAAPSGWTVGLPGSVGAALVGVLAVLTGELHWYLLTPLLLVPIAARLVPSGGSLRLWQSAFLAGFAALGPVAVAIGWAWMSAKAAVSAG